MTTTNDIDAIRQREQAASEGPWKTGDRFGNRSLGSSVVVLAGNLPPVELDPRRNGRNDARFIAHARTDVPALLAKVDELTAERDLNNDLLDGTAKALGLDLDYAHVHHEVPAKVAELVAALTQSRQQAATYANEIGALKADLERMRAERADDNLRLREQVYAQKPVIDAALTWAAPAEPIGVTAVKDRHGRKWLCPGRPGNNLWWVGRLGAGIGHEWHELLHLYGPLTAENDSLSGYRHPVAEQGCDNCSVEPGEPHRYWGCPDAGPAEKAEVAS